MMNRFHVSSVTRSDQNREIESRDHNARVILQTQSRKETELPDAFAGYFFAPKFAPK
jgi:hypothetical protein